MYQVEIEDKLREYFSLNIIMTFKISFYDFIMYAIK